MENIMLAVINVGLVVVVVALSAFAGGVFFNYLFFQAKPAVPDKEVPKIKERTDL